MVSKKEISQEIKIDNFNDIFYLEFGKNFSHVPEKHDFWEMVYVDSGEVIAITNGIGCALKCGQVIFHEPGEIHAHISNNKVANSMLVISFSTDSELMKFFVKKTFTLDKTQKTLLSLFINEAKNSFGKIKDDYKDKKELSFENSPIGSYQLLNCYLTEFLIRLLRSENEESKRISFTDESRYIAESSIAELMKDFMSENIYENLSLLDLCRHFMLGKSQISKIFKETCGLSPMKFYLGLKIKEAKRLLRNGDLSVSEISESLGYSDIYAFSRAFKKSVGVSPSAYKKRVY